MNSPRVPCPRRGFARATFAAVFAVVTAAAPAQIGQWASIPATGATTTIEQSLVVVQSGNTVRAFSALTRQWASVTTLFGAPQRTLLNESLIVRDGPIFHGFSPRSGAFASIYTSPTAALVPTSNAQTFASAVVDGNRLHVFFAHSGLWQSYTFAAPPAVTVGRFCMLIGDGTSTWAISDWFGTLVAAPAGAQPMRADGNMAFATSPTAIHGFGAGSNQWSTLPVAAPPTISIGNTQPTVAAVNDGTMLAMFSGHTGAFTVVPAPLSATVQLQRELAVVVDGTSAYAYSGLRGTLATTTFAAPPVVTMEQMFALLDDGTGVVAYSATTGSFAPALGLVGLSMQTRAQIAIASLAGQPLFAYSSMRNQWVAMPYYAGAAIYSNAVSVVLVEPTGGVHGWSQRGTNWIDLATPPIDIVTVGTNPPNTPETIYLRSGNTLFTFNPRTEHWRSVATAAPASLVRAHYQMILAQDGSNAYAFDIWSDRWTQQPLPLGYLSGTAQVQSAYVNDGAQIHAYGGFGQLAMIGEFPDFYRAATEGMPLRLDTIAEPGAATLLAVAFAPAEIALPFGTLLLDPSSLMFLSSTVVPPSGQSSLVLPVPAGLGGVEVFFQAAVVNGPSIYLTNGLAPLFL